ncbi:MAG: pilus assembly protein PilM [Patescibacteria group bacterium]
MSSKKTNFLGIDLGSASIKIVELENQKGTPKLVTYGYAEYSAGITEKDNEEKLNRIVDVVNKICQQAGTTSKYALAAMPGVAVFSSIINLPKMSHKELEAAIYWEAKKFIPMPIEEVILDWKILDDKHKTVGMTGKGLSDINNQIKEDGLMMANNKKIDSDKNIRILLTAAPKKLVEKYVIIFKKLGFELLSLETESFALSRALIGPNPESTLIIDLGANNTDIIIVEDGIPVLSRSVETGGDQISQIISTKLGLNLEKAEQFKRDLVFNPGDESLKSIQETLDAIIKEVQSSLELYNGQEDKVVDKIVLTGGTAMLSNVVDYFSKKLNKVVSLGNPWEQVIHPNELEPILDELAPRFSIALGLAMREIN